MRNISYENEFDLHENEHVGGTRFHMNGSHIQRHKRTRKWPIVLFFCIASVRSVRLTECHSYMYKKGPI